MSNPTTNYTVGGLDLSNIFQPLVQGSAIGYNTNYTVSGHGDLSAIFAAYTGAPGTQAPVTGYSVTGHGDLNTIFARKPIFAITGSLTYDVYTYGGYTGIVFTSGTGTITYFINMPVAISIIAIGGGGGGSTGSAFIGGASGGGGATMLIPNVGVYANTPFNIVVGNGGSPGSNGGDSIFQDPFNDPHIGGGGGGGAFGQSGGGGSISNNAIGGGGGGGGGGSGGGGVTAGPGGNNATAYPGNPGSASAGGTSFNNSVISGYPIYLPFISGNPQVYPGNGGGSGKDSFDFFPPRNGGLAGSNVGGLYGGASTVNGESAVSSINTGFFGAGGGGAGPGGSGGSGGSGVVIIYWQTV